MKIHGLEVYDAQKPAELTIQQRDVSHAKRKDPGHCVIARACKNSFTCDEVLVHLSKIYVKMTGADYWIRYDLPKSLRQEIVTFDRGGKAFIDEETYRLLEPYHKLGEPKPSGLKENKKSVPHQPKHYTTGVRMTAKDQW